MRLLHAVPLLFLASCAEAEEFVARPGEFEPGAVGAGGHTFTTGPDTKSTGSTSTTGGGFGGRGAGGTDGHGGGTTVTGGAGGTGGAAGAGRAGSVAAGGAPDAGLGAGGTGGMAGTIGSGGAAADAGGRSGAGGLGGIDGGSTCATGCSLRVQYQNATSPPEPMTATVRVRVDVFNTGTVAIPLADVTVRYWFTDVGGSGDKASCYYALDGCTAVTTRFGSVTPSRPRADRYLDIGFAGGGSLAPGAHTGTVSIGVQHVAGGPLYDQTDDYSYGANAPSAVDWPTITAYMAKNLAWGVEP